MRSLTFLFRTASGGLFLLVSFLAFGSAENLPVKAVAMPVANILSQTLSGMTPLVNGQRNDALMGLVCGLARGDISQQQVDNRLEAEHLNPGQIPASGSPLSLLVNQDKLARQMTCTAYLATTLLQPVSLQRYQILKKPDSGEEKKTSGWVGRLFGRDNPEPVRPTQSEFDAARFQADMAARLAVAKATAQMYALLAANLAGSPPLSWAQYQQRVIELVADYAPDYLNSVHRFYTADAKFPLVLQQLEGNDFRFGNAQGDALAQRGAETVLYSQGVMWLGEGRIFGRMDVVPVVLIHTDSPVSPETNPPQIRAEKHSSK